MIGIIAITIVMDIAYLLGRWLPGFSPQLKFFLLLLILLSSFSWLPWWFFLLCRISCTFSDNLLTMTAGPYHRLCCSQPSPWLYFSALLFTLLLFLLFLWDILFHSLGNSPRHISQLYISSLICAVMIFHITATHVIGL